MKLKLVKHKALTDKGTYKLIVVLTVKGYVD